ncbi:MAG TPA: ATP-binding protein [Gaiellaceae bacterium]|nr:ATP-binding protein [Gaiellaceae bacterium]
MTAVDTRLALEPRWLAEVRLRAFRRVLWCRELWERNRYLNDDALAIGHGEIDAALDGTHAAAEIEFRGMDERAAVATAALASLLELGPDPVFARLALELELDPAEQELLQLALAAELTPSLRRVYGYLQDETLALDPSPALAAELWDRPVAARLGTASGLVRWSLARPVQEPAVSATGWVADPAVLDHLLGRASTELLSIPDGPVLHGGLVGELVGFVEAAPHARLEIELVAPPGSGRATLAARVAARLGAGLVAVDAGTVADAPDSAAAAARRVRDARLAGALVAWRNAERLPERVLDDAGRLTSLQFLLTEDELPVRAGRSTVRRSYTLPPIGRAERLRLWSAVGAGPPPEPVAEWALRPAEVAAVAQVVGAGEDAVRAVGRRLLLDVPHDLLSRLPLPYTWDDLVVSPHLEAHLREFEAQARARGEVLDDWGFGRLTPLGRGVTALFSGPSGTGKTMAAQVLARSLDLELYRVDLAGVVNKYIGETEKHLRSVFAACERAPVLLFFDEADALFGRRMQVNDSHDRFANIEIDYLLQRMEQFDGAAVLATNRKGDLDSAFLRRLRFTIDFGPPTVDERERLWRLALEGSVHADGRDLIGDVDWPRLARDLDLTGAGIKSAALAGAFLARSDGTQVDTRHLLAASRRELEKQGLVVRPREPA